MSNPNTGGVWNPEETTRPKESEFGGGDGLDLGKPESITKEQSILNEIRAAHISEPADG